MSVDGDDLQTNIIMVNVHKQGYNAEQICDRLDKASLFNIIKAMKYANGILNI